MINEELAHCSSIVKSEKAEKYLLKIVNYKQNQKFRNCYNRENQSLSKL